MFWHIARGRGTGHAPNLSYFAYLNGAIVFVDLAQNSTTANSHTQAIVCTIEFHDIYPSMQLSSNGRVHSFHSIC